MRVLELTDKIDTRQCSVISVGNFDGVHTGHGVLLRKVVETARNKHCRSVIITFDPHTRIALYPQLPQFLLTTFEEKATLIGTFGIDYVLRIPFDEAFSKLSPDTFIESIVKGRLNTSDWIMGEGHAVGRDRSGGKKFLHEAMSRYHINTFAADLHSRDNTIVSSTKIRKLVTEGRIAEAIGMLGHPYLISAERTGGIKLGAQLGFPTLNFKQPPSQKVVPPPGVYAAELTFSGHSWKGALYFGDCPTFAHREVHLEFHSLALDGHPPENGQCADIWLYEFIRPDRSFDNADELSGQIRKDINNIRNFFTQESVDAFDKRA
jgi:riboflavin kinase / FMN adenylyltransferase